MVLSPGETYRISARVDTEMLDNCGIITESSLIRPYFINPVSGDPDIISVSVFLRSSDGEVVSKKVRYSLARYRQPEQENPSPDDGGTETGANGDPAAGTGAGTGIESPDPAEEFGNEDDGTAEAGQTGTENAGDPGSAAPTDQPGGSTGNPAGKSSGSGTSGSSNESNSGPQIIQRWNAATDAPPRMARVFLDNPRSEEAVDTILYVNTLNNELPPFQLPEDLEIGQYSLVFQLTGEREILHQVEKPLYYLRDAEFTLEDIQTYLPSLSGDAHIVSPGTMILLETRVVADQRLAPYVVWYNGKKRIGEGILIDGSSRLMWTAPTQTGFHAIRAEVFPFRPTMNVRDAPAGKIKELSLPVSSKQEGKGYFNVDAGTLIRWYQFPGNLDDAKAPGDTGRQIQPKNGVSPRWLPQGGIYGLALETGELYHLPRQSFDLPEGAVGRGRFMLRFAPLGEGLVFSGLFQQGGSPTEGAALELTYTRDELVLSFTAGGEKREDRKPVFNVETDGFITVIINFQLETDHFYAGLGSDALEVFSPELGIALTQPLSGGGSFQLGTDKPVKTEKKTTTSAASGGALAGGTASGGSASGGAAAGGTSGSVSGGAAGSVVASGTSAGGSANGDSSNGGKADGSTNTGSAAASTKPGPLAIIDELALTYTVELTTLAENDEAAAGDEEPLSPEDETEAVPGDGKIPETAATSPIRTAIPALTVKNPAGDDAAKNPEAGPENGEALAPKAAVSPVEAAPPDGADQGIFLVSPPGKAAPEEAPAETVPEAEPETTGQAKDVPEERAAPKS
jgi:hypothetical protein